MPFQLYNKSEAILDMKWAESLNYSYAVERAWRLMARVVEFIVVEGSDPGPTPPVPQEKTVEVFVYERIVNVPKKQQQTKEASHGYR